jgi:hypothetical protein
VLPTTLDLWWKLGRKILIFLKRDFQIFTWDSSLKCIYLYGWHTNQVALVSNAWTKMCFLLSVTYPYDWIEILSYYSKFSHEIALLSYDFNCCWLFHVVSFVQWKWTCNQLHYVSWTVPLNLDMYCSHWNGSMLCTDANGINAMHAKSCYDSVCIDWKCISTYYYEYKIGCCLSFILLEPVQSSILSSCPHKLLLVNRFSWGVLRMPGRLLSTLAPHLESHTATPSLMFAQREGNLRRLEEGGTAGASRSKWLISAKSLFWC